MSPIVSYWTPEPSSNMINPSSHARLVVGAVRGLFHQTLDHEQYMSLLADRLESLLNQEDDYTQALADLVEDLERNLNLEIGDFETMNAQSVVGALDLYLRRIGIPGRNLPERMPPNSLAAEKIYKEADLESWVSALTNRPSNPDR